MQANKLGYGGLVSGSRNDACIQSGQKQLKNNHIALII
jgi:hypothetical protein